MNEEVIHPQTRMGPVCLTVSDLARLATFYQETVGLTLRRREGNRAYLGVSEADLLVLVEEPGAQQYRGVAGLYHFAILLPERPFLALTLKHLAEEQTPLQGLSDHGVSEAIYLADPEGNGIEIYCDRPHAEWPYRGDQLQMGTQPLSVDDLMAELPAAPAGWSGLPQGSVIGHIHLHVSDLEQAEQFYGDRLGFARVMRYGPSASFLAAGGYHHHIGVNTWAGPNAPPPPPGAAGLRWFTIQLPTTEALDALLARCRQAEIPVEQRANGLLLRDPSGNALIVAAPGESNKNGS